MGMAKEEEVFRSHTPFRYSYSWEID